MNKLFVIDSLPRTGSTTLARLLNCHPDIRCLIEPFHPLYHGHFHVMAMQAKSVEPVLNLIRHRWNGIKHVWEVRDDWPFRDHPELNEAVALNADRIICLERRNLLRRYV